MCCIGNLISWNFIAHWIYLWIGSGYCSHTNNIRKFFKKKKNTHRTNTLFEQSYTWLHVEEAYWLRRRFTNFIVRINKRFSTPISKLKLCVNDFSNNILPTINKSYIERKHKHMKKIHNSQCRRLKTLNNLQKKFNLPNFYFSHLYCYYCVPYLMSWVWVLVVCCVFLLLLLCCLLIHTHTMFCNLLAVCNSLRLINIICCQRCSNCLHYFGLIDWLTRPFSTSLLYRAHVS